MTAYMVQRGTEPWAGISIITESSEYAEGFAAGLNHCTKRHWHRVEEVEPLPAGTPVRYWPGARHGEGKESTISGPFRMVGGTPCQYVTGAGAVAMSHIETIQENTK